MPPCSSSCFPGSYPPDDRSERGRGPGALNILDAAYWGPSPACVVLLDDARLLAVSVADDGLHLDETSRASLPEGTGEIGALIADAGRIVAVDEDAQEVLVWDDAKQVWSRQGYGASGGIGDAFVTSQRHAVIVGEDFLLVGRGMGGEWQVAIPSGWSGLSLACIDAEAWNIFINDGDEKNPPGRIAASNDGGEHWQVISAELPYRGLANGFLWLRTSGFRVFGRAVPAAPGAVQQR